MPTTTNRSVYALALLVFVAVTALYLALPTGYHGGDAIQAAMGIENNVQGINYYHPSGERLYEPGITSLVTASEQELNIRYYLDYPTSTLVGNLWRALGWQGNVIMPVIVLRNIVGGLAAMFAFLGVYELYGSRRIALIVSVGLALTGTYWTFSTDIYQSINMVMLIVAAFYVLVRLSKSGPTVRGLLILAVLLAGATLYNIMAVLAMPGFGLAVLLLAPGTWIERFKKPLILGVGYGVACVVGLMLGTLIFGGGSGQINPFEWRSAGSGTTVEVGGFEPAQDAVRALLGFGKAQIIFPGITVRDYQALRQYWDTGDTTAKVLLAGFYVVVLTAMFLPAVLLVRRWRKLPGEQRWLHVMLPTWLVVYALFNWYWLPSDVHYWMIPIFALWLTIGLYLSHVRVQLPGWYRPASLVTIACVALTFIFNLTTQFLPENQNPNPWATIAESLRETESNALFLTDGHPIDFYIAYLTHRDVLATTIVVSRLGNDLEQAEEVVNEQIRRHRADDGEVYLYSHSDEALTALAEFAGLTNDQLEPAYTFSDLTIYRVEFAEEG